MVLIKWDWAHVMALSTQNPLVLLFFQHLRYWWNDATFSSTSITFDRLYLVVCNTGVTTYSSLCSQTTCIKGPNALTHIANGGLWFDLKMGIYSQNKYQAHMACTIQSYSRDRYDYNRTGKYNIHHHMDFHDWWELVVIFTIIYWLRPNFDDSSTITIYNTVSEQALIVNLMLNYLFSN